jgi:hypothetical protein
VTAEASFSVILNPQLLRFSKSNSDSLLQASANQSLAEQL